MFGGPRSRGRWCLALVGMLLAAVFSFLGPALAPNPPTVILWQPNGGEHLAGGSNYSIRWWASGRGFSAFTASRLTT